MSKNHYRPELDADNQIEDLETVDLNSEKEPNSPMGWRIIWGSILLIVIAVAISLL